MKKFFKVLVVFFAGVVGLLAILGLVVVGYMYYDKREVTAKAELYKSDLAKNPSFKSFISTHRGFSLLSIKDNKNDCLVLTQRRVSEFVLANKRTSWEEVVFQVDEALKKPECRLAQALYFRNDASRGLWRASFRFNLDFDGNNLGQPEVLVYH